MSDSGVLRFSGFRRAATDLERSIDFYVNALGFALDADHGTDPARTDAGFAQEPPTRRAKLVLGRESIELFAPVGCERHPGADVSADAVADLAFHHIAIVTNDMAAAHRRLQRYSPTAISSGGPVQLPSAAGGVVAFKFRDPDGHPLELIGFPKGVGDPRWQAPSTGPTLGIDHSAISVSNAARSLAFYSDVLGLRLRSRQTNHGAAQARLDGVPGAEVEVLGLAPSGQHTPHLELLAYRVPSPGRAHPLAAIDDDHSDLMTFVVGDLSSLTATLAALPPANGVEHRSIDAQTLLLRDSDGHLLLLRQPTLRSPPAAQRSVPGEPAAPAGYASDA